MDVTETASQLAVRLARDPADLAAVQQLRWQVFVEELGARSATAVEGLEADAFDNLCDHLLVTDQEPGSGEQRVVGTYRLLRESVARRHGGFYSAGEFDLSPLFGTGGDQSGELLELGRSCVLPAYRTSQTIALLWRGISQYLAMHRVRCLFGCASFAGTDPAVHAAGLSYLAHRCLAPADRRPGILPGKGIPLEQLPVGSYDERSALIGLPPLVKGYMRAGACFGEGAYVDHDFRTIDVCVILPIERISSRYANRFHVAA
ncbi:GNAT family N-acyltransferase [Novosphingobium sp.]|uniref:GNAT family N-acetyltransferase n=1 Tax=Novosphingobium sp. TaxID=1874826 RepID=UPI00261604BD|nr:GNAT family N-acyltransferase [Novosphingobium sp.]